MILLSTHPQEPRLRQWLDDSLGKDDAADVHRWLADKYASKPEEYVASLAALHEHTEQQGPTFLRNFLAHTRKPKERIDAEETIRAWFLPRAQRAADAVRRANMAEDAIRAERDALAFDLKSAVWRWWPDKHRATLDGALVVALRMDGSGISLDIPMLVETLFMPDALADSAAYSRS